jgi:hypothetical protein
VSATSFTNGWAGYKHGSTWAIYGDGLSTDPYILFDPPSPPSDYFLNDQDPDFWTCYGAHPQRPDNGDGTVPASSGSALITDLACHSDQFVLGTKQYQVTGVDHEAAYRDGTVQELVTNMIKYTLTLVE